MVTRRKRVPKVVVTGNLARTASWGGLRPGDPVEIEGTKLRSASWTYVAHVRNTVTDEEWIEVVGGKPGDRKVRSFRPNQVFAPSARKTARASLADAPQLPF